MRTFDDIYEDFCKYLVQKSRSNMYTYQALKTKYGPTEAKSLIYKQLLKNLYHPNHGLYFFCKFILGDLSYVGLPKPFQYNNLLRKWDVLVKEHKNLAILASRGHGKCVSGDTLISLADGTRKRIKDIEPGTKIISFNDTTYKLEHDTVLFKDYVGDKTEYTLTTKQGSEISCAETHKFFTIDGWKELKNLKPGDYITLPRQLSIKKKPQTINDDYAWILGWLISEGECLNGLVIWQKNDFILNEIIKTCKSLNVKAYKHDQFVRISKVSNFFKDIGGTNSYTKRIPEYLYYQPDSVKFSFLSSMFEGDGYLDARRKKNYNLSYSSMSKNLIYDLKHLLLTLGINSFVKKKQTSILIKKYGTKKTVYILNISRNNISYLLSNLKFISKNKEKEILVDYYNNIKQNTNIDVIPVFGCFNKYLKNSQHNFSRTTYNRINKNAVSEAEYNKLKSLSTSDIFWDKIENITKKDIVPMYDIQVENNHSYIANDIITHNSLFFSVALNLYDMFIHSYRKILITSSSQEQAVRILGDIAAIVDNNECLKLKKDPNKWSSEKLGYNKGYVIGKGIGSEVLGEHLDRIILDDVLRSDNKLTDTQIEDYIDLNLMPMLLNRDGQMIIVGCVNEHTYSITDKGIIKLKNLKQNNNMLQPLQLQTFGLQGLEPATDLFNNGFKDTLVFKTELGYDLECTPNHPLYVKSDNGHVWKRADELKTSDTLCLQSNQHTFGTSNKILVNDSPYSAKKYIKLDYHLAYTIGLYLSEGFKINDFLISVDDMLTLNKELVLEMVRGYVTANGLVSSRSIVFEDSNYENIKAVQMVLLNLGIVCRYYEYQTSNDTKVFRLDVLPEHITDFYNQIVYGDTATDTTPKLTPLKIKSITPSQCYTLDFVIPKTHSFCSNGIISHNTPKSPTDIFATIKRRREENPNYLFGLYSFPAIIDEQNKILQCPERFSWDSIIQKRETMGALKFAREYQLQFYSRDQSLFPKALVNVALDKGKDWSIQYSNKNLEPGETIVIGVDVATSGSASADYSVAIVLAYNPNTQSKRLLYMWRRKGLKISEQSSQLAQLANKYDNPLILVEKNNVGQTLIDELIDDYNLYVETFTTGSTGNNRKDELVRFAVQCFEREQIIIPNKTEEDKHMFKPLIEELDRFCITYTPAGNEQYRGVGGHDDTTMSLCLAIKATQDSGVPFAITKNSNGPSLDVPIIGRDRYESDLVNQLRSGFFK